MMKIPEDAIQCFDKGFVRLVDSMGGDDACLLYTSPSPRD